MQPPPPETEEELRLRARRLAGWNLSGKSTARPMGLPARRFEDSQMTSFSSLILLQALFARLGLKESLRQCFSHLTVSPIFGHATLVLCLVLHLTLGYRGLRDISYCSDDPWSCGRSACAVCPMSPRSLGDWRGRTERVHSADRLD